MRGSRILRLVGLLVTGAVLVLHALRYDYLSDDAFIFARYARNLVEGRGLVFNPGERVEGFTSMLWVLLLSAAGALGLDYVLVMRALGMLCALASLWLVQGVAARGAARPEASAFAAALLTACAAPLACWSLAGLETPAFALALLVTVASFRVLPERRDLTREAAALSACVLLRPEGALVVPVLAAVRAWLGGIESLRRAAPALLSPLFVLALLTSFRLAYYGDAVPNTARAKDAVAGQLQFGLWYAEDFFRDHGHVGVWLLVVVLGLTARGEPALRLAAALSIAFCLTIIWVGGDGLCMYRFFAPIMPLLALLFVHGVDRLAKLGRTTAQRALVAALALASLLTVAGMWWLPDESDPQYRLYDFQQRIEIPRWTEVGRWLARNTAPDASVACVPIGAIGYYSRRVVRDMVGLTDRHIASLPSDPAVQLVGHRKHDGPYILSLKPTVVLTGNVRVLKEPLPLSDPDFGRPRSPAIRARERDLFGPELARNYEPAIARLSDGQYLHYYRRRAAAP